MKRAARNAPRNGGCFIEGASGSLGAIVITVSVASCGLFLDTSGFSNGSVTDHGTGADANAAAADTGGGGIDGSPAGCVDGSLFSAECVAKAIPTDGLTLWLRADDGVETTADGHVTAWRDSIPKLRPGYLGSDAKPIAGVPAPVRITEPPSASVVFGPKATLELPPGFDDFTSGVSLFFALWPQLDPSGSAGTFFALGYPPQQDDCGRTLEVSVDGFSLDYRVENMIAGADSVFDGRGWDVVSIIEDGAPDCANQLPVALRHGTDTKRATIYPLTKAIRSGSRLGRSTYFPDEYFAGKLAEILVYDRKLSDADVDRVTAYLTRRWPRP